MAVDVLLGLQWGDEGKGKIVDFLADKYDFVCRFQGGPNAGHTLYLNDEKFVLHTIPSGIFRPNLVNIIGNGVVIDPITLQKEVRTIQNYGISLQGRLKVAQKSHLILPTHRLLDAASEAAKGSEKIGSTLKGIGPTYMDKTGRNGIRIGDIFLPNFMTRYTELKKKHLRLASLYPEVDFDLEEQEQKWFDSLQTIRDIEQVDTVYYLADALAKGSRILAEGAQGSMLDIDFGTYPFVTSSNTITAGVCIGLGIAPTQINEVIGISKAYCTRVGSGPFPTELEDEVGERLRKLGKEFGATTGRPRRCGWLDLPQLKYACIINGVTQLILTKVDVLNDFDEIAMGISYQEDGKEVHTVPYDLSSREIKPNFKLFPGWGNDISEDRLPKNLLTYVQNIEEYLGVTVPYLSIGPGRDEITKMTQEQLL